MKVDVEWWGNVKYWNVGGPESQADVCCQGVFSKTFMACAHAQWFWWRLLLLLIAKQKVYILQYISCLQRLSVAGSSMLVLCSCIFYQKYVWFSVFSRPLQAVLSSIPGCQALSRARAMWCAFWSMGFYCHLELDVSTSGVHKMGMMRFSCLTAMELSFL